eukprot:14833572-Ditylum_brightwellii.AAC.1
MAVMVSSAAAGNGTIPTSTLNARPSIVTQQLLSSIAVDQPIIEPKIGTRQQQHQYTGPAMRKFYCKEENNLSTIVDHPPHFLIQSLPMMLPPTPELCFSAA